jgi:hypothetical protein
MNEKLSFELGSELFFHFARWRFHCIAIGVGRTGCDVVNQLVSIDKLNGGPLGYKRSVFPFFLPASANDIKAINKENILKDGIHILGCTDYSVSSKGIGGILPKGLEILEKEIDPCISWTRDLIDWFDSRDVPIDFILIVGGIGGGTGGTIHLLSRYIKNSLPDMDIIPVAVLSSINSRRIGERNELENTILSIRGLLTELKEKRASSILFFEDEDAKEVAQALKRILLIGMDGSTEIVPILDFLKRNYIIRVKHVNESRESPAPLLRRIIMQLEDERKYEKRAFFSQYDGLISRITPELHAAVCLLMIESKCSKMDSEDLEKELDILARNVRDLVVPIRNISTSEEFNYRKKLPFSSITMMIGSEPSEL